MTHHEIVKKLIGPIMPVGESHADEDRFRNLQDHIDLVDDLVRELHSVADLGERYEASIKRSAAEARAALNGLRDYTE